MNPITFNDFLPTLGVDIKGTFKEVLLSPLVEWVDEIENDFDVLSAPEAFYPNVCPRLPFPRFRVDGRYRTLDAGVMRFKAWVLQHSEEGTGYSVAVESTMLNRHRIYFFEANYRDEGARGGVLPKVDFRVGVFDRKGRSTGWQGDGDLALIMSHEWLSKLAMDFHNPHLHLCKKAPTIPSGKTVTWQKAREHYVLLHKNHAANSRGANGKRVIQDSNPNRCAHSRRAHYRLLSSPRFKNRVGQRVWVKSSWVGPKEWEDRSGQIYKIVE